ncbi:MAG: type II secretion system minor pseudopilin GspK [Rhodospirillaceae bacterium]
MKRVCYHNNEKGAVLLTVLLLVTFIASLAIAMLDDIRFGIRRTANIGMMDQAQWFAYGAEELAKKAIYESWRVDPGRSTLNDPWAQGPTVFPVEGGLIEGRLTDGSNCFNLNSLVVRDGSNRFEQSDAGLLQYQALLRALGFGESEAESLVNTAADWIDSDSSPSARGAEDTFYMSLSPPYRTANTLVGQVTELRAMRDYSEDTYQRIQPFVCALPNVEPSPININTLTPELAPLVVMLVGSDLKLTAARQVIVDRPRDGFGTLEDFWGHDSFAGLGVTAEIKQQVSVRTRYFSLQAEVTLDQVYVSMQSLLEQRPGGEIALLSRSYGEVQ